MSPPPISIVNLFLMLIIFAGGSIIFYFLNIRWTRDRRQTALQDWAREHKFKLRAPPKAQLPAALQSLTATVESSLTNNALTLIRISTTNQFWNLLIRETKTPHTPAGLRPRRHQPSFLDLFALTDFPSMSASERFIIAAADSRAAKEISKSPARGLLPPDVGLILHGPYVTLDFTNRPFDTIEFERMLAVMQQISPA
jgi:hypothetical protein